MTTGQPPEGTQAQTADTADPGAVPAVPPSPHLTPGGEFVSDKYPWCPTGFLALKFTDPNAWTSLLLYARMVEMEGPDHDRELVADIRTAVANAKAARIESSLGGVP